VGNFGCYVLYWSHCDHLGTAWPIRTNIVLSIDAVHCTVACWWWGGAAGQCGSSRGPRKERQGVQYVAIVQCLLALFFLFVVWKFVCVRGKDRVSPPSPPHAVVSGSVASGSVASGSVASGSVASGLVSRRETWRHFSLQCVNIVMVTNSPPTPHVQCSHLHTRP
jgi:hypothetical protein